MEMVVKNFLLGLDKKKIGYNFNKGFFSFSRKKPIISFGLGEKGLIGVAKSQPVIAAIGFPHPLDLPLLCEKYNIAYYLQHSKWALELVRSAHVYPDNIFKTWPSGIDTDLWIDVSTRNKQFDVLIYDKLYWQDKNYHEEILSEIVKYLENNNLKYCIVQYGRYLIDEYQHLLSKSSCMIFLSAHETQGFACLEALSSNVPVFAWDQGLWLDPARFRYNQPIVPATSIPFFDERCGDFFCNAADFSIKFPCFFENVKQQYYTPRNYILENLTIEKSTEIILQLYKSI